MNKTFCRNSRNTPRLIARPPYRLAIEKNKQKLMIIVKNYFHANHIGIRIGMIIINFYKENHG